MDFNSDLETLSDNISEAIQFAARESTPRSKGSGKIRKNIFWDECEEAVKDRNKAKRKARISYNLNDHIEYKKRRPWPLK